MDAIATKRYQKNRVNRSVLNKILIKSSNSLSEKIENVELRRDKFLNLLDMFVQEEWKNAQTYNSFIKGFGESFDDFSDVQATKFVSLLIKAGLNQVDILEAVIEKVMANTDTRTPNNAKVNMVF